MKNAFKNKSILNQFENFYNATFYHQCKLGKQYPHASKLKQYDIQRENKYTSNSILLNFEYFRQHITTFEDISIDLGEDVTAKFVDNVTVEISGNGPIVNSPFEQSPFEAYKDNITHIIIKEGISEIGDYTFFECNKIIDIFMSNTIIYIGECAFQGCELLRNITFSNNILSLGFCAFDSCTSLENIILPESLEIIEAGCFEFSGLKSIIIPDSVIKIDVYAFGWCPLETVVIGSSLTNSPYFLAAFSGCNKISSINISKDNKWMCMVDDVIYSKDMSKIVFYPPYKKCNFTLPDSVVTLDYIPFHGCYGLESLTLNNNIKSIPIAAFSESSITSIIIPESVECIEEYSFIGCNQLKYVEIKGPIDYIRDSAFYDCSSLETIILPNTLKHIGEYAFNGCSSLKSIEIPGTVTLIEEYAFSSCNSLTSITFNSPSQFNESMTLQIESDSFSYCNNLQTVNLSSTAHFISPITFSKYEKLQEINVDPQNKYYSSINGVLFNKQQTELLQCPRSYQNDSYTIPDSVETVLPDAFSYSSLQCLTVGSKVKSFSIDHSTIQQLNLGSSIEYSVSYCQSLTSVSFGPHIKSISGFSQCSKLTYLTFRETIPSMYQFSASSTVKTVVFEGNITSVDEQSFSQFTLDYLIIGESVEYIDPAIFYLLPTTTEIIVDENNINFCYDNSVLMNQDQTKIFKFTSNNTAYSIPETVETIGSGAFYNSKLSTLEITPNITFIEPRAFPITSSFTLTINQSDYFSLDGNVLYDYNKTRLIRYPPSSSVTIPDTVTSIDPYAFESSTFTSLTLSGKIESIGKGCFYQCYSLVSIVIQNDIDIIPDYLFYRCTSLSQITLPSSIKSIGKYSFYNCKFGSINLTSMKNLTIIDAYAFRYCTSMTSVTLSDSLEVIGENAFENTKLNSVELGKSLKVIGNYAFYKLPLISVVIPDTATVIGNYSFYQCTSLETINIGSGVKTINSNAFRECSNLINVYGGDSVEFVGEYAFYQCQNLQHIKLPKVKIIEQRALYQCSSMNETDFGSSIEVIGDETFEYCQSLLEINLSNIWSLGSSAFRYCKLLRSLTIGNNLKTIDQNTFYQCNSIESFIIPDSMTDITEYYFLPSNIKSITISKGVKEINAEFLYVCEKLAEIIVSEDNPYFSSYHGILFNKEQTEVICCPRSHTEQITFPKTTTTIKYYAFYNVKNLNSLILPEGLKSIESLAFCANTNLASVILPKTLQYLSYGSFAECPSLTNVTFVGRKEPELYFAPFFYSPVRYVNVPYNYLGSSFAGKRIARMPFDGTMFFSPNYKSKIELTLLVLLASLE